VHIQLESLIAAAIILLVSFPVHEFSHAYVAYRLGDGTAKMFGRLTLNPIVHFDPIGGLLLIASSLTGVGIGWAKPTPVNPANLRGGSDSEGIVAFAGPASNLVLAAIGAVVLRLVLASQSTRLIFILVEPMSAANVVPKVLFYFVLINVALLLFNLVPIPPLDGSKVLFSMMNPRQVWQWRPTLEQYGFIILLFVAFVPLLPGQLTIFGFIFEKIGLPIVNLLLGHAAFF
jgi:Zn-dependent protease